MTYIEYQRRGLETFPEEVPLAFDWMDRHRRDPYPKSFRAFTARTSDDRFYGVVVREFSPGHTTSPEAADVFGANLNPAEIKMASSSPSNLIRLDLKGVQRARSLAEPQARRLQAKGGGPRRSKAAPIPRARSSWNSSRCSMTSASAATGSNSTGIGLPSSSHWSCSLVTTTSTRKESYKPEASE